VIRQLGGIVALVLALTLAACSGDYSGGPVGRDDGGNSGGGGTGGADGSARFASVEDFFAAEVQPGLAFCRSCHVPDGVAGSDPDAARFMLSPNPEEDYQRLHAAWQALGEGITSNLLLVEPGDPAEPHSGGKPWPEGGARYTAMRTLLACWEGNGACEELAGGADEGEALPLLGNPGKHFFVNEFCDGASDDTPIDWSRDPRRLLTHDGGLIDSETYAVHFNDPYEICKTETLFETQARQNELREAAGETPIYSARPDPKTCGEWRASVQRGHDWIAMWPSDQPMGTGEAHGEGFFGTGVGISGASAEEWNNLWRVWGMPGRPDNFDRHVFERYGHSPPPAHIDNPYPLPDELDQLSADFGGSGTLPLGWAQGRDEDGNYNGTLGLNCFSCHAGQIGSGQVAGRDGNGNAASYGANAHGSFMGLPNTNTELGVLLADLINASARNFPGANEVMDALQVPAFGYIPVVNTTRGTNAADTEIEAIFLIRDWDTLNFNRIFAYPTHANTGDQDPPAWWWLSNKTRYLWFGGHSTDSVRGNMYFGSVNALSGDQVKANEGTFEDVHQWTLTVEAPDYPYGYCSSPDGELSGEGDPRCIDRPLAEQGAILFHEKDLWAEEANADIPRPKGNGACAGCHGAYAPRYIYDQRFLPDPALAGTVGYTVPLEIVATDPAQAEGWSPAMREHVSTMWHSYPDAVEGYVLPEEENALQESLDDYLIEGVSGADLVEQLNRHLEAMGALQPVGDLVDSVLEPVVGGLVPELPLGDVAGRVHGACGFEEKTVGYVTPPLHGVWASAPYFHNGSVPDVWGVLKPEDRPKMWRRQRTTTDVHFNQFETRIADSAAGQGGYNWERLGWKHDVLSCNAGSGIPYYSCQPDQDLPQEVQWLYDTILGGLVWPTWLVPPPIGEEGLAQRMIYNTQMYSKKNHGHEWTQALTDDERRALLEYLKTL
jgi:hypothetical protein